MLSWKTIAVKSFKLTHINSIDKMDTDPEPNGLAIIPYNKWTSEKIKIILAKHNVKSAVKPFQILFRHRNTNLTLSNWMEWYSLTDGEDCKKIHIGQLKRHFGTRLNKCKKATSNRRKDLQIRTLNWMRHCFHSLFPVTHAISKGSVWRNGILTMPLICWIRTKLTNTKLINNSNTTIIINTSVTDNHLYPRWKHWNVVSKRWAIPWNSILFEILQSRIHFILFHFTSLRFVSFLFHCFIFISFWSDFGSILIPFRLDLGSLLISIFILILFKILSLISFWYDFEFDFHFDF